MGWVDLGRLGHTVILQTVVYTVNNYLHTVGLWMVTSLQFTSLRYKIYLYSDALLTVLWSLLHKQCDHLDQ